MDSVYAELRRAVQAAGLLNRAYGYYLVCSAACFALFALALALPFALPPAFAWSALAAILIGFASVQLGLLGHDAGHLAVFRGARANWALGSLCWSLALGIGFWYWRDRHNRHHAHPNDAHEDPDLWTGGLLAFTEADAAARRGWRRIVVQHQALIYPCLAPFTGFGLRIESWLYALRSLRGSRRLIEIVLLALNALSWAGAIGLLGWRGLALFASSQMIGSLYLALVVAPNHKGMPVWTEGAPLSFLERQVSSSRNIAPHPVWDVLFGGLNYQIEHHLFPTMPRAHLKQARALVKPFCAAHGLPYEEVNPLTSYRLVFAHLRRVGRAAAGPLPTLPHEVMP